MHLLTSGNTAEREKNNATKTVKIPIAADNAAVTTTIRLRFDGRSTRIRLFINLRRSISLTRQQGSSLVVTLVVEWS